MGAQRDPEKRQEIIEKLHKVLALAKSKFGADPEEAMLRLRIPASYLKSWIGDKAYTIPSGYRREAIAQAYSTLREGRWPTTDELGVIEKFWAEKDAKRKRRKNGDPEPELPLAPRPQATVQVAPAGASTSLADAQRVVLQGVPDDLLVEEVRRRLAG